jgi:predicted transcriptional regulator
MLYRILANYDRLNLLYTLAENGGRMSLRELRRETGIEIGLLAYQLGVMKATGLIEDKRGGNDSDIYLTPEGEKICDKYLRNNQ